METGHRSGWERTRCKDAGDEDDELGIVAPIRISYGRAGWTMVYAPGAIYYK
jgi:hypothetical protein